MNLSLNSFGYARLPGLLQAFEEHETWETVVPVVFDRSAEEFEETWHTYLKERYPTSNLPFCERPACYPSRQVLLLFPDHGGIVAGEPKAQGSLPTFYTAPVDRTGRSPPTEIRFRVQHLRSGEVRYFREWPAIITYLTSVFDDDTDDPLRGIDRS